MLQERNKRGSNRCNLLGRHIHQIHVAGWHNRVIIILTALHLGTDKGTIIIKRGVTLTNNFAFLFLCCHILYSLIRQIYDTILYFSIRSLNKAQIIYFSKDAKGRYKSDIRTFRRFNGTKTTIMSVMYVTHLESCTLTRQSTGSKCRKTTFVCYLCQWIRLIHELG